MKKFLQRTHIFLILLLGISIFSQAQKVELYGLATQGPDGPGTIFNMDANGAWYVNKFNFSDQGANPLANFETGADGKLYGLALNGGSNSFGAIFSLDPLTGTYTKLYSFDNTFGAYPYGSLKLGADGKLYGMAGAGGNFAAGVIFSFDPTSFTYTSRYNFDYTNGSYPHGGLTIGADGKFYGLTTSGGSSNAGVIFSFDPTTDTYNNLHSFDNTDGGSPHGNLTLGPDSLLYGTTVAGGANGVGVLFSFDPAAVIYSNLHSFDTADGASPYGNLTIGSNGKFYGLTTSGGVNGHGILFSYNPGDSTFNNAYNFDFTNGAAPYGNLTSGVDGKFYGVTSAGGSGSAGVIFSFDPSDSVFTNLKNLDFTNGGNPYGSLALGADGTFYGMTYNGGSGYGVLFNFDPASSAYNKLHSFDKAGGAPHGSLTRGSDGKFYGMASNGGLGGYGIIFSFDPVVNNFSTLYNFNFSNGSNPNGSLTLGNDGKLYGLTFYGGIGGGNGYGVIFSYDPGSNTQTLLYSFDNTGGSNPYGSLLKGNDGLFYGLTVNGGSNNAGVIFSFDPGSSTFTNLYNFDNTNGGKPYGSLTIGADGKLYGLTTVGGNDNVGVIFSFDPVASTFSKAFDFSFSSGGNPYGNLTLGADSKLYGLTANGGSSNFGVLFHFDPATSTYGVDYSFLGSTGAYPAGSLIADATGKLYGMTQGGGTNGQGVVFTYTPSSSTFTKIFDFNSGTARVPLNGQLSFYLNPDRQTPTVQASNITFSNVYSTQMKVSFTPGDGKKRLVVVRAGSAVNWTPTDDHAYPANSNFSLAADVGSGNKVVMADVDSEVNLTGLTAATTYFVKVFEFNSTITEAEYLLTNAPTASKKMLALPMCFVSVPANNAVNQNISITTSSSPVAGAITYTIELNTAADFTGTSFVSIGSRTHLFTGLSFNTIYYARVKTNLSPDYGKVTSFSTAPAEFFAYVTAPADGAVGVSLSTMVTSNVVTGAQNYQIELSTDPNFISPPPFVKSGTAGKRTQSFTGLLTYNTKYYARVKTELSPNYGVTKSFTTVPPTTYVTYPADNATNQLWDLTVIAGVVAGNPSYIIQLSPDITFTTGVIQNSSSTNKVPFTGLAYGVKYYSRVSTSLAPGLYNGPVKSFTVADPSHYSYLVSPVNGATNQNWSINLISYEVPSAGTYFIEVATDPGFTNNEQLKSSTSRTINFTLLQGMTYYARVKTSLSSFGATQTFSTGTAVTLAYVTSPINGGTGVPTSVTVYAHPVKGAMNYTIELNTDPNFIAGGIVQTLNKSLILFSGLSPSTTYYTRVYTNLAVGQWGPIHTSFTTLNPGGRDTGGSWRGDESEEEVSSEPFQVKIFGNPFHERLSFLIESQVQQEASVSLYDMTGKTVHESSVLTNTFVEIEKSMTQGIYLLRVKSGDQTKVVRVVKID